VEAELETWIAKILPGDTLLIIDRQRVVVELKRNLVTARLDASAERIINYLSERYGSRATPLSSPIPSSVAGKRFSRGRCWLRTMSGRKRVIRSNRNLR
jgi:hypothetical protein